MSWQAGGLDDARQCGRRYLAAAPRPVADRALGVAKSLRQRGLPAGGMDGGIKAGSLNGALAHAQIVHPRCTSAQETSCTDIRAGWVHHHRMEQLILAQSDHMVAVGSRLRRLIRALGIKYVEAAADMGISKNHLGNWMRGDAYPTPYELYKFCRVRGVTTDYIFLGDPSGLRKAVWEELMRLELEPVAASGADRPAAETPDDT